jgi:lipopolysaccharide/colanic/teichoic acid biosynthesis glycosyltransferase
MIHTKLVSHLGRLRRWIARKRPGKGLPSPADTHRVLERERARADRTGAPLAVVAFAARSPDEDRVTMAWLVRILPGRLRCTDEAGWLDEREICAVLPGTPARGAWKVADDVCLQFPNDVPLPLCSVYSYPSDRPPAEGNGSQAKAATPGPASHARTLDLLLTKPVPAWKRTFDLCVAAVCLLLLAPVLGAIALAIKLTSRGPVLFKQWRSGRGDRPFIIYKFRTMLPDAEAYKAVLQAQNQRDGPAFKIERDPRTTKLGRFLRSTSLDELPQLWNVLKGDMCLVGPRPLPCAESDACAGWQRQRLAVTPGITCIWQVRGRGGVPFAEWVRMDMRYIRTQSPWQDLKLLLLTVPAVLLRRGAH